MANAGTYIPFAQAQYFDNSGNPLNGGKLFFYAAGTSTPLDTYQNAALTVANANPLVLNSAGRPAVAIFWQAASYKITCTTSAGVTLWTVDNVPSTGLSQSIVGVGGTVWQFGGTQYTPIENTSYTSGSTFDACDTDTSFLTINSSQLVGDFALSGMLYSESGITTTVALVNLSDGSPDTPIATISSASTTGTLVTSSTISFAAAGVAKTYAIKSKVSSGRGFRWSLALTRTA